MPFYLSERDISPDLAGIRSALIVPCRFCPAASLAVRADEPYIQLFRHFLRTPSYEAYLRGLASLLRDQGISTEVFDSRLPHQFIVCMWTGDRRDALAQRGALFDAVVAVGCDAAVETVQSAVRSSGCRVIAAMQVQGLMNVIPTVRFPFDISLQVGSVIRMVPAPDPARY